jgi:hypothetical protein
MPDASPSLRFKVAALTNRIVQRSAVTRQRYLEVLARRQPAKPSDPEAQERGVGGDLFTPLRASLSRADQGGLILGALAG